MKKIIVLAVLLLSVTIMASAQKSTRTTAYNYLRKSKLDLAKENIDKAVGHEKTMNDPKTWFYYGNIYIRIATDTAFQDIDTDALTKAYDGYMKCKELDEKNTYEAKVFMDMAVIANNYYSRGLKFYNVSEYSSAYEQFNKAVLVNEVNETMDTMAVYASAMSAGSAEMLPEAKKGYELLIEMDFDNASIYNDLASIYKKEGDQEKAITTLVIGMEKYPNNVDIIIAKINILMADGKKEEVMALLENAIELAPENSSLYFVQGVTFEQLDDIESAVGSYKNAIEIKPDYVMAIYNLGVIEYTKASDIISVANDLPYDPNDTKYDDMLAEAIVFLLSAQPYLESVLEIGSDDEEMIGGSILSLKEIYNRTKQNDKLMELNNR